jgi:adenylosuccinate synthase
MVINLKGLYEELMGFEADYPGISKRVYVDPDAFLIEAKHLAGDGENVKRLGSTNKGVGPAYVSKMSRNGRKIADALEDKDEYVDKLIELGVNFKYALELKQEFLKSSIIFEGAQGVMLDLNHGTYPYVSCGDATVAGIAASGFAFLKIDKVYGIAKAYSTKVGEGPFPTEIFGDEAKKIAEKGLEKGSVTGRDRRIGWLDLPALRYARDKGGITSLIITKFDILDGYDKIKVATSYEKEPVSGRDFFTAKPIYEEVAGWKDKNDPNMNAFITKIEESVGLKVEYISCGVGPDDLIKRI